LNSVTARPGNGQKSRSIECGFFQVSHGTGFFLGATLANGAADRTKDELHSTKDST